MVCVHVNWYVSMPAACKVRVTHARMRLGSIIELFLVAFLNFRKAKGSFVR